MICFQPAAAACRSCLTRVRSPQIVHSPGMRIVFPGATWPYVWTIVARGGRLRHWGSGPAARETPI